MGKRKETFVNKNVYHIILRSVEGIPLFRKESDYFRMIFGLYEFNTNKPVDLWLIRRLKNVQSFGGKTFQQLSQQMQQMPREKIVDLLAFCLMPNHIHLLLKQVQDNGITTFVRKFATGYAMYFNKKYERTGHLFQGAFRAVYIDSDAQLKVVFIYIHANPLSIIFPKYKEVGIDDTKKAKLFLENYKWSSYQDYLGRKNFPSVTERDFLLKVFGGRDQIEREMNRWIEYKNQAEPTL